MRTLGALHLLDEALDLLLVRVVDVAEENEVDGYVVLLCTLGKLNQVTFGIFYRGANEDDYPRPLRLVLSVLESELWLSKRG